VKDTVIPEDLVKNAVMKALKTRIEDINQKWDLKRNIDYFERKYSVVCCGIFSLIKVYSEIQINI
jgi:hypothetical protein